MLDLVKRLRMIASVRVGRSWQVRNDSTLFEGILPE
jgi:hypothetical protein